MKMAYNKLIDNHILFIKPSSGFNGWKGHAFSLFISVILMMKE